MDPFLCSDALATHRGRLQDLLLVRVVVVFAQTKPEQRLRLLGKIDQVMGANFAQLPMLARGASVHRPARIREQLLGELGVEERARKGSIDLAAELAFVGLGLMRDG